MAISMLKIRRPLGRLIFNMGIAIPGKTVFLIETAPWYPHRCTKTFCVLNDAICSLGVIRYRYVSYELTSMNCHLLYYFPNIKHCLKYMFCCMVKCKRLGITYTFIAAAMSIYIKLSSNWLNVFESLDLRQRGFDHGHYRPDNKTFILFPV